MIYPTITIDKDVPMDGTFPPEVTGVKSVITGMSPGDSFFMKGVTLGDVAQLIAYAASLGTLLEAREGRDTVYFANGVRLWRVSGGILPVQHDTKPTVSRVYTTIAPDITSCNEKTFWLHPESDCVFTVEAGETLPTDGLSVEISEQQYDEFDASGSVPVKSVNNLKVSLTQPGDDKRKFYVIESESGNHFTWGSSLPLAEQKLSEDRQKMVHKITHQQFMDLEAKNFTMHYWINKAERRYFYICSALNTNAGFNQVGCEEVDYDAYVRFKHCVDAGLGLTDGPQYVRNLKTGDMQVIDITGWSNDQLKRVVGRYETVSREAYDEWNAENEL